MTIYFTASLAAKDQYLKNYELIIAFLKQKGYQVISDHITGVTESQIRLSTRAERLNFHTQLEKWIRSADFMIAETSFPSISVGYEISLALRLGKPVLILYSEGDPPSLLAHHQNDRMYCEKYTFDNFKETIMDFIDYIQGKSDTRFTFFITPQQAAHLDEAAHKEKIPKAVYLRKLIDEDMEKKGN
jgi:hypothetical protein